MQGFFDTLKAEEDHAASRQSPGAALVTTTIEDCVNDFFSRRWHSVQNREWSGRKRGAKFDEGVAAGKSIKFRRPVTEKSAPKLLR